MNKQTALTKFIKSRQALLKAISRIKEKDINTKAVEGVWTTQDLLAHLHSWEMNY
jgi:hypothetical protein